MFLLAFIALALVTVPVAGGHLTRLADLRLRGVPWLFAALIVQVLVISFLPGVPDWVHPVLHIATYVVALAFVLVNRSVPGAWIVFAGGASNFVAIAANEGVMPATRAAMRAAGLPVHGHAFANSAANSHARLGFLGDVFALPASWPIHNVFSVGDVLIAIGAFVLLHVVCDSQVGRLLVRIRPHRVARA